MFDEHSSEEERGAFNVFPEAALCILVVTLLLTLLLAMNTTQNDKVQVSRSTFSGGVIRPSLHLECTVPEFGVTTSERLALQRTLYAGLPFVAVHLFTPSPTMRATDVRGGETAALGDNRTVMQQQDLALYQFMLLAPGIDPGSFSAGGQEAALLIPSILDKPMVYEPDSPSGYRVNADRALTKRLMAALWPIYQNPVVPARRTEEYNRARTRVYVESRTVMGTAGEEHYVVIGHLSFKLPEALDDGSLAWLGGFSSGVTEIVFLGELWSDPEKRTNRRIDFMRSNGYISCAAAYTDYAFPGLSDRAVMDMHEKLLKAGHDNGDVKRQAFNAAAQVKVSGALLEGRLRMDARMLYPPLLAHPDAWAAYITHYEKEQPEPPRWFYDEFLDRLGFARMAVE